MIGTHALTDPALINAYHTSLDVHHKTPGPMHVHALNRGPCVIITFSGGEGFKARLLFYIALTGLKLLFQLQMFLPTEPAAA